VSQGLFMNTVGFRVALLAVLALASLIWLAAVPPFPQDTTYHSFADQRTMLGIPHALNVLSNAPFIVFGLLGIVFLLRPSVDKPALLAAGWRRWALLTLFVFVTLTGVGSSYYHAHPDNATLFWDRLPLTVVFMTFFALVLADRVRPRLGPWLWLPLVAAGVLSVAYWHWTETLGRGDIRPYVLVQFVPLLMLPVILLTFPARQFRTADLLAILAWYALAKLLELLDGVVYATNGFVSGHTLKHLVASLGALWMVMVLVRATSRTRLHHSTNSTATAEGMTPAR
jgi:hypothetical protein